MNAFARLYNFAMGMISIPKERPRTVLSRDVNQSMKSLYIWIKNINNWDYVPPQKKCVENPPLTEGERDSFCKREQNTAL